MAMEQGTLSILARYQVGGCELILAAGDPLAVRADAVLCYSSNTLTFQSHLATRLVLNAGPALRLEAGKHAPARIGDTLVLPAGKLPYRYLLVAIINALRTTPTLESIRASLLIALERATNLELRVLALPLLRVRRKLNDDDVLITSLAAVLEPLSLPTSLRQVTLVMNDDTFAPPLVQRVADLLPDLVAVAQVRMTTTQLASIDSLIESLDPMLHMTFRQALLQRRRTCLQQALQGCEQMAALPAWSRSLGVAAEVRRCRAELAYIDDLLTAALDGRERTVGAEDNIG